MSKVAIGLGCAFVVIVGWWTTNQLTAQESAPIVISTRQSEESTAQLINDKLDEPLRTPLSFEGEQLNIVLEVIADEYEIPIVFDKAALDEVAISPESEVTFNLRNVSLRSALRLMLLEPGLEDVTFAIHNEVLLITTKEREAELMFVRVYNVHGLDKSFEPIRQPGGGNGVVCFSSLANVLTNCIHPKSWAESGNGGGQIQLLTPGILVVMNTERVHHKIEQLLSDLRRAKLNIERSGHNSSTTTVSDLAQ